MAEDEVVNEPSGSMASSETPEEHSGIQITREDNKANIMLDMSMLDLFLLCPQRYDYRHNHNKEVHISEKSESLDSGSLMHEGMEVYFNELAKGTRYADRINAAIMKIRQESSDPSKSNSDPDEVNNLIRSMEESCEYWRHEDETLEILAVEQAFAYVLYEDDVVRIIITGKIDLLVNKPGLGSGSDYKSLPIDHKTFRRDFPVLRLSNQFMNYCFATKSNFLLVNRIGLQKTLTPEQRFKRIPLSYDPIMLEEWKQNVVNIILQQYLACVTEDAWPMNLTSCLKFNRLCEYYDICDTSGKENKLYKLESKFETASPWDVTARFNKGK